MRKVLAGVAAMVVLIALWPALCMESENGASSCSSAVFLPLPWSSSSADTWGMVTALLAAIFAFVLVLKLPRRNSSG